MSTVPAVRRFLRDVTSRLAAQEEHLVVVRPRTADFATLGAWLAAGKVRAVIDSRLASKRARGKIVIEIG